MLIDSTVHMPIQPEGTGFIVWKLSLILFLRLFFIIGISSSKNLAIALRNALAEAKNTLFLTCSCITFHKQWDGLLLT